MTSTHTRILMSFSALVLAILGLAATFAPQELLTHFGGNGDRYSVLMVQVFGAAYIGFAMLNWMARENLIGGIYSRPVAMGNFFHFTVAGLALLKFVVVGAVRSPDTIITAIVYCVLAVWFGAVVFTSPVTGPSNLN